MAHPQAKHTHECCEKPPFIGATYRRMIVDPFTNKELGHEHCKVIEIESLSDTLVCRRVLLRDLSDGSERWVQIPTLYDRFEAVDNIVNFPFASDTTTQIT